MEDIKLKYFYHGSYISEILWLKASSKLHNSDINVVYLTDCIPYALLYIWDATHNGSKSKHITAWVKNGVTYYEEQFPDQLKTFYQGVTGNLYFIADNPNIKQFDNFYYSSADVSISKAEQVFDVYEELIKHEEKGSFVILRYNDQSPERQQELTNIIASSIIRADFYKNNEERRNFMKKYFSKAWNIAKGT